MTLKEYTEWYNSLPLWFRIWNGFLVKVSYLKPIFGFGLSYNEKILLKTIAVLTNGEQDGQRTTRES